VIAIDPCCGAEAPYIACIILKIAANTVVVALADSVFFHVVPKAITLKTRPFATERDRVFSWKIKY